MSLDIFKLDEILDIIFRFSRHYDLIAYHCVSIRWNIVLNKQEQSIFDTIKHDHIISRNYINVYIKYRTKLNLTKNPAFLAAKSNDTSLIDKYPLNRYTMPNIIYGITSSGNMVLLKTYMLRFNIDSIFAYYRHVHKSFYYAYKSTIDIINYTGLERPLHNYWNIYMLHGLCSNKHIDSSTIISLADAIPVHSGDLYFHKILKTLFKRCHIPLVSYILTRCVKKQLTNKHIKIYYNSICKGSTSFDSKINMITHLSTLSNIMIPKRCLWRAIYNNDNDLIRYLNDHGCTINYDISSLIKHIKQDTLCSTYNIAIKMNTRIYQFLIKICFKNNAINSLAYLSRSYPSYDNVIDWNKHLSKSCYLESKQLQNIAVIYGAKSCNNCYTMLTHMMKA
jgi:hypothetical protein